MTDAQLFLFFSLLGHILCWFNLTPDICSQEVKYSIIPDISFKSHFTAVLKENVPLICAVNDKMITLSLKRSKCFCHRVGQ